MRGRRPGKKDSRSSRPGVRRPLQPGTARSSCRCRSRRGDFCCSPQPWRAQGALASDDPPTHNQHSEQQPLGPNSAPNRHSKREPMVPATSRLHCRQTPQRHQASPPWQVPLRKKEDVLTSPTPLVTEMRNTALSNWMNCSNSGPRTAAELVAVPSLGGHMLCAWPAPCMQMPCNSLRLPQPEPTPIPEHCAQLTNEANSEPWLLLCGVQHRLSLLSERQLGAEKGAPCSQYPSRGRPGDLERRLSRRAPECFSTVGL